MLDSFQNTKQFLNFNWLVEKKAFAMSLISQVKDERENKHKYWTSAWWKLMQTFRVEILSSKFVYRWKILRNDVWHPTKILHSISNCNLRPRRDKTLFCEMSGSVLRRYKSHRAFPPETLQRAKIFLSFFKNLFAYFLACWTFTFILERNVDKCGWKVVFSAEIV